tara:strand:+ start:2991 stop:4793 length:1803 start_codon:yes stop_codon:yes gene_type:complete
MPVSTGSDTRMYSPRSESNLGYANDAEDNPHGVGDPETMEQLRDKRMAEAENKQTVHDLPHLRIDVPNPEPEMPPVPDMPEEPMMDDDNENARGAEVSQMTGMPDMGNLSIGNATGTMPQPGGMLATGEPMDIAWRLLKNEDELARYDMDSDQYDEEAHNALMDKWAEDTKQLLPTLSMDDVIDEKGNFKLATNNPYPPGHWSHKHSNWNDALGWDEDSYDLLRPYRDEAERRREVIYEAEAREKAEREEKERMQQAQEKERADKLRAMDPQITEITRRFQDAFEGQGKWLDVSDKPIPRSVINSVMEEERGHARIAEFPLAWKHALARIEEFQGIDEDINTGEPMDSAWSELMKARNLRSMGRSKSRAWKQPQYKIQPGGSDISTATSRRSKLYSRHLQPHKHRGIDRAPLSVHRTHLGIATKQPLRLFPRDYGQQTGSMQRRKWQGNIPAGHPSGHAMGPEVTYNPRAPKAASSEGRKIRAPGTPRLRGQTMGIKNTLKSEDVAGIKEDLSLIKKKMSYMHFAQMRRLMRKVKEALADKERRLKARVSSGPGKQRESGHMEGQDKTTRPTGATDSLDIPESWGAPSTMFAARGSGRVG